MSTAAENVPNPNSPSTAVPFSGLDLPALGRQADLTSRIQQTNFIRATQARLVLLVIVATGGAISLKAGHLDVGGAVAAVCFASVAFIEVYLWQLRPEKAWYLSRALAESVKTLTWRYAVRAEPFNREERADELFLDRLRRIKPAGIVVAPDSGNPDQITRSMRTFRAQGHEERREAYLTGRIDDQLGWYGAKTRWNEASVSRWSIALLLLNTGGLAAALAKTMGLIEIDFLGIAGAVAASGVAWVQTRQYGSLAAAYATAHYELTIVRERIRVAADDTWAREVDQAEEAISREHTMWQASRSDVAPVN